MAILITQPDTHYPSSLHSGAWIPRSAPGFYGFFATCKVGNFETIGLWFFFDVTYLMRQRKKIKKIKALEFNTLSEAKPYSGSQRRVQPPCCLSYLARLLASFPILAAGPSQRVVRDEKVVNWRLVIDSISHFVLRTIHHDTLRVQGKHCMQMGFSAVPPNSAQPTGSVYRHKCVHMSLPEFFLRRGNIVYGVLLS